MGSTNKPLHIIVDSNLMIGQHAAFWETLAAQGHIIEPAYEKSPDIFIAPYAMRMTADMLAQLPKGFELAIKGARTLRYSPEGKSPDGWKKGGKGVQTKTKGTRKNSKKQAKDPPDGQSSTPSESTGVGGAVGTEGQPGETSVNTGNS